MTLTKPKGARLSKPGAALVADFGPALVAKMATLLTYYEKRAMGHSYCNGPCPVEPEFLPGLLWNAKRKLGILEERE